MLQLRFGMNGQFCVMMIRLPYDTAFHGNPAVDAARKDMVINDLFAGTVLPSTPACVVARCVFGPDTMKLHGVRVAKAWGTITPLAIDGAERPHSHTGACVLSNPVAGAFGNNRVMRIQVRVWHVDAHGQYQLVLPLTYLIPAFQLGSTVSDSALVPLAKYGETNARTSGPFVSINAMNHKAFKASRSPASLLTSEHTQVVKEENSRECANSRGPS